MKTFAVSTLVRHVLVAFTMIATTHAQTAYDWGSPTEGGIWSNTNNWSPIGGPGALDTAVLTDVTSGNRVITNNSSASVTSLDFNQTTSGATNTLLLNANLSVTNAVTLGAPEGVEEIRLTPSPGFVTLTMTSALTLNSGGLLTFNPNGTTAVQILGSGSGLVIAGGAFVLRATNYGGASVSGIGGPLTMSSGSFGIESSQGGSNRDLRIGISGNVNITGGSVTNSGNGSGVLTFGGASNTLQAETFSTGIQLLLDRSGAQTLDTANTLGILDLRGTGVKTVTSTAISNRVSGIRMRDNNTPSAGVTLRLGSNLTLTANGELPNAGASTADTSGRIDFGIDTQGFTLDLSAGAGSGIWRPNAGSGAGVVNTVWTLSGATNGAIRANAFAFTNSGVTTDVGAGAVLGAVGGNSTANDLGGTGTINADSIFRYSGAAAAGTPATLTFNRNIGDLEVTSGALRLLSNAVGTVQDVRVIGGTLDLQGAPTFAASSVLDVASGATLNVSTVTGGFVVGSSQTLRGSGTIVGDTTINGALQPGSSPGLLTFSNDLTLGSTAVTTMEINSSGARGTAFDAVNVGGIMNYDGALSLSLGTTFGEGTYSFKLFNFDSQTGSFDTITLGGSYSGSLTNVGGVWGLANGNDTWTFTQSSGLLELEVVPEPSTYALLSLAAAGLGAHVLRRRRNRH